jgi:hypothetical protein
MSATHHHVWKLIDLAALACKMYLHLHGCTVGFLDQDLSDVAIISFDEIHITQNSRGL